MINKNLDNVWHANDIANATFDVINDKYKKELEKTREEIVKAASEGKFHTEVKYESAEIANIIAPYFWYKLGYKTNFGLGEHQNKARYEWGNSR